MLSGSNLIQIFILGIILLIVSIIFAVFSPFSICFIIFSIIRAKTSSDGLRKVSFVFQIIFLIMNFLLGIIISLLFLIRDSGLYIYDQGIIATVAVIVGVCFVSFMQIAVIIWEGVWLRKDEEIIDRRR